MKRCLSVLLVTLMLLTCIPVSVFAVCGIEGHRVTEPTCTEDGVCRDCGIVYAALGHRYDESGICGNCGEKQEQTDAPTVPVEPDVPADPSEPAEPDVPEEPVEPDVPDQPGECPHQFEDGVVVEPTCVNDGLWEYYCTLCYNRYVDTLPATGVHRYVSDCAAECEDCGAAREPLAAHTYSNPCDSYCDRCNYWRGWLSHVYDNACDTTCNHCDYERQVRGHDYDYPCDAVCNECGFTRVPGDHEYDLNCDSDCNYCGLERPGYGHVYSDSRDAVCNVCGGFRETTTGSDVIYMQPWDVMTETPGIYITLYIEASGDYDHTWYLCPPNGNAIEMATGWRMDMVLTEDLNNSTAYCVLTHRVTGATVYSRTVTLHIHVFNNDCDATCNQCRYQRETPGHSYDAICDHDCNRCGAVRSVEHTYGPCSTECYYCGIAVIPTHEFSAPCDEVCDGCGAGREAAATHTYDNVCDGQCNVCLTERDVEPHWYDNDCDTDCNACGEIRQARYHWYDDDCDPDCNECGEIRDVPGHQYDDDDDAYCNVCGAWRSTDPSQPDVSWCDHRNSIGSTCVGEGFCADCGTVFPAQGHQYDDEFDQECNNCYAWRELEGGCDHEAGEPWCYGGNVNGLHVVVYDCIHCYKTLRTEVERCYGGTATCWDPAQCERCYLNYGDADGDHVYDDESDMECNLCGEPRQEECPHQFEDGVIVEPSCGEDGLWEYYCTLCYDRYVETLPATGEHTYDDDQDADCNVCGQWREVEPSVPVIPDAPCEHPNKLEPTCAEDGYCPDCGVTFAALGHDWIPATCLRQETCGICGETRGELAEHTYDNDCDAICNVEECGYNREIAGHIWNEGVCSVCGAESPSKPAIIKEPKTGYAKMGEKVNVSVTAEGEGLRYEWWIKNSGSKKYSKSSVTKATYSATMSDKVKGRRVYCIITDQYGNQVQSNTVLLREAVSITKESATAAYAKKGAKVSVKVTASGDGLKYTWYIKNDGGSKYSKSSVTSATYSTTMSDKAKNRRVYCVVKDKYGKTVQSKTFLLRESVSITTQPKTVSVAKNKTAKVTVKASGDGLKYTWYIKNAGQTKYSKSSVTKATYSTTMNSKSKNRLVYCVVTDKYGKTVKTVTVKLKMK